GLLRTRSIDDPALRPRFEQLAKDCGVPLPFFEQVDLHGGVVANAFALPSLRRSAVVFSETVIARLTPDELVAICGHELAHLEHYNARYLRGLNVVNLAMIVAAAVLSPVIHVAAPSAFSVLPFLWPVTILVVFTARARRRQQHETESDLRSVALTGDGEALV